MIAARKSAEHWSIADTKPDLQPSLDAFEIEMVNGKTADDIRQLNVDELFERLNLDEHLSPNRHAGVMVSWNRWKPRQQYLLKSRHAFPLVDRHATIADIDHN